MSAETLARIEHLFRPLLMHFPASLVVHLYSRGRLDFLEQLKLETPSGNHTFPAGLKRRLWELHFRTPLMNAAGMFKNGECYEMTARQGAGAYLGGTGTWNQRLGNERGSLFQPFTPYARSYAASNWLGLPNDGDITNIRRLNRLQRKLHFPLGWSVMRSPDLDTGVGLFHLVQSMHWYMGASVDFLELNESCPNTGTDHKNLSHEGLEQRLRYIKERFLDQRTRNFPVIVKFSTDTRLEDVPRLLDMLFELGYDGVNFGNTSTNYRYRREFIHPRERTLYDYFTQTFGGGVSGRPLKESSLALCAQAVNYLRRGPPSQEFHVLRTGGIESLSDITESDQAGVSLNQWFTGYFEAFSRYGHDVYHAFFSEAEK